MVVEHPPHGASALAADVGCVEDGHLAFGSQKLPGVADVQPGHHFPLGHALGVFRGIEVGLRGVGAEHLAPQIAVVEDLDLDAPMTKALLELGGHGGFSHGREPDHDDIELVVLVLCL